MNPTFRQKLKAWSYIPKFLYDGLYFSLQKRNLIKIRYEDCCVVSYPKSGRTWLRVMFDYLHLDIEFVHDSAEILYTPQEKFVLKIDKFKYQNKKVIFLIRHPIDVIVSSYFQAIKRQELKNNFSISDFIRDEKMGIKKLIDYQNYWLKNGDIPKKFKVIRYEKLKENPVDTLKQILIFFEIKSISMSKIRSTVKTFEFQNMQLLEKMNILKIRHGGKLKPKDRKDPNSFKTRQGKVKGYTEHLTPEDVKYCEQMVEKYSELY